MKTLSISNCLIPVSIFFAVSFALSSCNKDDENDINPPSGPSEGGGEDHLNPDVTYGSVTDQDGNNYATIIIGEQEWMAENLRVTRFSNGDSIPNVQEPQAWESLDQTSTGAWSNYNNDPELDYPYGKLYNFFVVEDERNICPDGWHVPTLDEWAVLVDYLGGQNVAGEIMKSTSSLYWSSASVSSTNESGFSAVATGTRGFSSEWNDLGFAEMGEVSAWWTSDYTSWEFWFRGVSYDSDQVFKVTTEDPESGTCIRCVRNQ